MQRLARYTIEKASSLELDGDGAPRSGRQLELALTGDRVAELHRRRDFAESWGLAGRVIDFDETARLWPLVDRSRILGAYHVPSDGLTDAVRVSEAQARRAAEAVPGSWASTPSPASGPTTAGSAASSPTGARSGRHRGLRRRHLGAADRGYGRDDRRTPAPGPPAHMDDPAPEVQAFGIPVDREAIHPNIRVQDRDMYFREYGPTGGRRLRPRAASRRCANDLLHPREAPVMPSVLEFTPDTFAESWRGPRSWFRRFAARGTRRARHQRDLLLHPGRLPADGRVGDVTGFWLAEAVWVTHALGVGPGDGRVAGRRRVESDLHECDLNRFEAHQLAPAFIHDRGIQNYIEVYDIVHPLQPMEEPRPLRTSPFYEREQELGAYFLEGGGWERPHWYGVNERLLGRYEIPGCNAWAASYWHPIVGAEARATRDGVACTT